MSQSGEYTLIFWHMCMKNISSSYISITTHTKWVNFNTQGKDRSEHSLLHPLGPVRALAAEMRIPQPLLSAFISVVMFEGEWEDQMLNPDDYYGKEEEAQSDNASSWKLLFVVAFQSYLHFFPCTKIILLCTHEWGSWASILWRVWHIHDIMCDTRYTQQHQNQHAGCSGWKRTSHFWANSPKVGSNYVNRR